MQFFQKQYFILFCLLFSSLSFAEKKIDLVFDLDKIFLYSTDQKGPRSIRAKGEYWNVAVGAEELIESLSKIPGVRISFYSARSEDRNVEAMKKIKISTGKSFYDLASGRVFSSDHMEREGRRKVKDFEELLKGVDLNNAILIDDSVAPVSENHRKNLLWVYYRDRVKRLALVRGVLEAAINLSAKNKIPLSEALYQTQFRQNANDVRVRRIEENPEILAEGLRQFKKVNPNFSFPESNKEDIRKSSRSPTSKLKEMIKKIPRTSKERKKHRKVGESSECDSIFAWLEGH